MSNPLNEQSLLNKEVGETMENKKTNLEIIRQACIKANPEIMELKFGCRVDVAGCADGCCGYEEDLVIDSSMEISDDKQGFTSEIYKDYFYIMENKGREIRLSDVLNALDKIEPENWVGYKKEEFFNPKHYVAKMVLTLIELWDLTHDNLEDQSEETLEFISNLLKEK